MHQYPCLSYVIIKLHDKERDDHQPPKSSVKVCKVGNLKWMKPSKINSFTEPAIMLQHCLLICFFGFFQINRTLFSRNIYFLSHMFYRRYMLIKRRFALCLTCINNLLNLCYTNFNCRNTSVCLALKKYDNERMKSQCRSFTGRAHCNTGYDFIHIIVSTIA